MRKLRFMVVGMGFLSLFSCTKTSQYVVDKYVEEENKKLPISLTEYMSYDSIKCDKNGNNVIMYYALKNELIIEAVKAQDNEVTKRVLISALQKDARSQMLLKVLEESGYALTVKQLTKEHEVVKEITITPEEFSQELDETQTKDDIKSKIDNEVESMIALCPAEIDEFTTLKNVAMDWEKLELTYMYDLHDIEIEDKEAAIENLRQAIKPTVLGPTMRLYRESDIAITYQYYLNGDTMNVRFTKEDYKE